MKSPVLTNWPANSARSLGEENYDLRPVKIAELIEDVMKMQRPHLAQSSIQVEELIPKELPVVAVDGDKIKQVLLNLIKNAAEAMPSGGKITIEARATANVVPTGHHRHRYWHSL